MHRLAKNRLWERSARLDKVSPKHRVMPSLRGGRCRDTLLEQDQNFVQARSWLQPDYARLKPPHQPLSENSMSLFDAGMFVHLPWITWALAKSGAYYDILPKHSTLTKEPPSTNTH